MVVARNLKVIIAIYWYFLIGLNYYLDDFYSFIENTQYVEGVMDANMAIIKIFYLLGGS